MFLYSAPYGRVSAARSMIIHTGFTEDEHLLFQKLFEEGTKVSNIKYEMWLKMYHPFSKLDPSMFGLIMHVHLE